MPKSLKIRTNTPITIRKVTMILTTTITRKYFALLSGSLRYSFMGSLLTSISSLNKIKNNNIE